MEPITTAALVAGGLQGAGAIGSSIFGGGGEEQKIPWQNKDYATQALNVSRQMYAKLRDDVQRHKYEGFPGARNLRTQISGATRSMMDSPPPDYYAQAGEDLSTVLTEGIGALEERAQYSPSGESLKPKEEYTEWDKMAEERGIVVTKYEDYQDAASLQKRIYEDNWGKVSVGGSEIQMWQHMILGGLNMINPSLGKAMKSFCGVGQCDEFIGETLRHIKVWMKTAKDMGEFFSPTV